MGSKQKAQQGLALIKEAILESLQSHLMGLTNAEIADALDLRSDYLGGQKDYLPWSVLGLLLNDKQIRRSGRRYLLAGERGRVGVRPKVLHLGIPPEGKS